MNYLFSMMTFRCCCLWLLSVVTHHRSMCRRDPINSYFCSVFIAHEQNLSRTDHRIIIDVSPTTYCLSKSLVGSALITNIENIIIALAI
jgi:hypothetical protein